VNVVWIAISMLPILPASREASHPAPAFANGAGARRQPLRLDGGARAKPRAVVPAGSPRVGG